MILGTLEKKNFSGPFIRTLIKYGMLLLPILFKVEKKALGYLNGTNLKTSCVILFLQELDKLVIYYVFF